LKGYLIDLQVKNNKAVFWFKSGSNILKIEREYHPYLYVLKKDFKKLRLNFEDEITYEFCRKKIFPKGAKDFVKLIFKDIKTYNLFIKRFSNITFYDSDLLHSQKIIFKNDIIPFWEIDLRDFRFKDDLYRIPPLQNLRIAIIDVELDGYSDPSISSISFKFDDIEEVLEGEEEYILKDFQEILNKYDVDIGIVNIGVHDFLKLIYEKSRKIFDKYSLGREDIDLKSVNPYSIAPGRIFIDYDYYNNYGIVGLQERCYFSMLPPIAYRWTAGRLVDSRQTYIAMRKGYVIPPTENINIVCRTAYDLFVSDRGGMLQTPIPGLYENVAVLDFESMFPNIIVKYNVSYETVDLYRVKSKPRGLLVDVVEPFLKRRLYYKRIKEKLDEPYRTMADQRQSELKMLLVSSYGYSGNNYNRFGNTLTYEWINRISREIMSKVYEITRENGFKIIYSDTDSIFVQKKNADIEDFEKLRDKIERETKLPIKVDRLYKFLVLLPMKIDKMLGGSKRYFGRLFDGELDLKGIEYRRHDYPEYIKDFQYKLADTLLRGEDVDDIRKNYSKCLNMVVNAIDEINDHKVPVEKLVIRKVLRKSEYKVLAPHYIASLQLKMNGIKIHSGEIIEYIYINAYHRNPLRRVKAWKIYDGEKYDAEKYVELLLDAAETILTVFGFNRNRFQPQQNYFLKEKLMEIIDLL